MAAHINMLPKVILHSLRRNLKIFSGLRITPRYIHCSSILRLKMFKEYENTYAYNIMENKGFVKSIDFRSNTDNTNNLTKDEFTSIISSEWSQKSPNELFQIFSNLGIYCSSSGMCISNSVFDSYIDNLTDNLRHASDKELKDMFYAVLKWPETQSIRTRNYIEVWAALDDECLRRLNSWSFDEMLSYVALFYMLNTTKVSEFTLKALQKCTSKSKQLTVGQYLQTMFFIGVMRKSPFDIHLLEIYLESNFSKFSVDELAIISMGFFKSKTPIRSPTLLVKIVKEIINNAKDIHEVSLAALLKIIRYSLKSSPHNIVYDMLNTLQHEVPRLSNMCNVHIALVGMATMTFHKECLDAIAHCTIKTIASARLKDLERLVLAFGTFNFKPNTEECFFEKIMSELRSPDRIPEIEKYGRTFACCVGFLGICGYYPQDLMKKTLTPEFLLHTYGKQVMGYGKEILIINNTAKLFCNSAEMNLLPDKAAKLLAKKFTDFMPNEDYKKQYNVAETLILDVVKTLKEDRGNECVIGEHVLTHHQRGDILVCNDVNGCPVEVKKYFDSSEFGLMRKPPNDNIWVALVISGRNSMILNTDTPTGPFLTKVRELNTLGYRAALVVWSKYTQLKTKEEKCAYLNNLINDAIKTQIVNNSVNKSI